MLKNAQIMGFLGAIEQTANIACAKYNDDALYRCSTYVYKLLILSEENMKYANHIGYTDINPFEVIRAVSDKTLEIREMNAQRDESVKLEFVVGGFSAICLNDSDQEWFITSDDTAPIIRIRLGKNGWKDKYGRKYRLADQPVKFYDHNF